MKKLKLQLKVHLPAIIKTMIKKTVLVLLMSNGSAFQSFSAAQVKEQVNKDGEF